ncbi:hypothetical protein [Paenibacillus alvei]|uniref:hypothetical protein n=1 Tax=Paenibacillus alvei TaxID=44250 RepID=UPI0013DCE554|nr:hypothetical protein [Paenibacillus alvei]NEZ44295.1 hypothetical protein [Paenibacillus alvei]
MMMYNKMIAVLSITSLMFMSMPVSLEAAPTQAKQEAQQENGTLKLDQIDQEILDKLDKIYQELSGSPELQMTWERINTGPDGLYFFMDGDGNQAQVKPQNGEVRMAHWFAKASQAEESQRLAAASAVKALDPSWSVSFDNVQRSYNGENGKSVYYTYLSGRNIGVSLEENKTVSIKLTYDYAKVPQNIRQGTTQLLQALDAKTFTIKDGTWYVGQQQSSWKFTAYDKSNKKRVLFDVDGKTGKATGYHQNWNSVGSLLSITDKKYSKFKNENVLAVAKPLAKKVFGLDLTGYGVTRGKGDSANYFTFKKDGKPEVSGHLNEKGEFYALQISSK